MDELRLFNSLTRTKERFEPLAPPEVRVYSCGPTVYARQHLGNLRAYVFADLLTRTLGWLGYETRHVVNITDVGHLTDDADAGDDKMEKAARERGETAWDVAERWTDVFRRDLAALSIREPDVWSKATDHIPEQIEMVRTLEAKGFTYATSDGIYFDTSRAVGYPAFGHVDPEALRAQARIAGASEKKQPTDFALWKLSDPNGPARQMEWESPWGVGFPGWHIECSAMSTKHLGAPFDIHTGGIDHLPVHHPNEIAQSEAALGVRPWVRFWLHGGWLMLDGGKISKSKAAEGQSPPNLDDLVDRGIHPLSFRLFLLGGHYRQQMSLTDEAIAGSDETYRRLRRRAAELGPPAGSPTAAVDAGRERLRAALVDDLNAPRALAVLHDTLRDETITRAERALLLRDFDAALGLGLAEPWTEQPAALDPRIEALVAEREAARRARDFARADAIRDQLAAEGFEIEDTPDGPMPRRRSRD
jgi:cysteinyl-tRNA synthetase